MPWSASTRVVVYIVVYIVHKNATQFVFRPRLEKALNIFEKIEGLLLIGRRYEFRSYRDSPRS